MSANLQPGLFVGTSVLSILAGGAVAQTTDALTGQPQQVETVVVTGTHIAGVASTVGPSRQSRRMTSRISATMPMTRSSRCRKC